jgi:iron complex outermembrane receptor protein
MHNIIKFSGAISYFCGTKSLFLQLSGLFQIDHPDMIFQNFITSVLLRLIFAFLFFISWNITNAQSHLQGKVNSLDSRPLPGANIFIHELNRGTVADQHGMYLLSNIPNGKFRVQYSYLGYTTEVKTIFFNGSAVKMDIILNETSIETREIVISGGYNATQHENAVNIDILNLNTNTSIVSPNTAELLTKIPGVSMISKGPGVSKPVIRGLSMDNVLVLNNGVRNENYQYSDHHPLGIDEYGIRDVEIIKGPASLLYGSDAIGGVVNFIREHPAPVGQIMGDFHLQLFSNTLGLSTSLGLKGASKSFFGGVRFGTKTNADFLEGGGNFVPNSRFNTSSFKVDGGYSGKKGVFKLFYEYSKQNLGLTEEEAVIEITDRGRENEIWYQQFNNHLISSQNKIFLNKIKIDLNAAFQSVELVHYAGIDEVEIDMRLSTLTYEAKIYFPSTEKSEYILGFQGFNQENKNIPGAAEILLPDANTNNYGFFTLLQYYFFHGLKVQAGLRYDNRLVSTMQVSLPGDSDFREALDKKYGSFSGSVGATYELAERLFFRANFAAAYRTPNIAELTSNGMHEARYELGNSGLVSQNAYETDVSIHYHVKNLTIDLAGYYNIIDHYIYISPTSDTTFDGKEIYKYTQDDATLIGGEAGIHLHPEKIKWLHIEAAFSSVTAKQSKGDYLPFIPAKKLTCELKFEKEKIWKLKGGFFRINSTTAFNQEQPAPEEEATDGYTLVDAGIGTTIPVGRQELLLQLSVNNLFDKKYTDHLSTLKEVGFFDPGRNIALSVSIPFTVK